MKEIDTSIDRGEGGEEKEKERKKEERKRIHWDIHYF